MEITLTALNTLDAADDSLEQIVYDLTLNAYYLETKQYGMTVKDAEAVCDENFYNSVVKVIKVDGHFAGWVIYRRRGTVLSFGFLYICREFRMRGVGLQAMKMVIEESNPTLVYSNVFMQNSISQSLHEKLGFHKMAITYLMNRT